MDMDSNEMHSHGSGLCFAELLVKNLRTYLSWIL